MSDRHNSQSALQVLLILTGVLDSTQSSNAVALDHEVLSSIITAHSCQYLHVAPSGEYLLRLSDLDSTHPGGRIADQTTPQQLRPPQ